MLLNLIEEQQAEMGRLQGENQRLRDELARLTDGSGRSTIRPQAGKQAPTDHSSERERHTPTRRRRRPRSKLAELTHPEGIHQVEMLAVDPALLPPDAVFKGNADVIVQDLLIQPHNTRFQKAK